MKRAVLIFAKNLIYGEVKTRLAATVGNDVSFAVYKKLLQHTKEATENIMCDKIVFYSNHIEEQDIWHSNLFKKHLQSGRDLGEKMQNAFAYAFDNKCEEAIIIGTDCFDLTSSIINDAFSHLKKHDIVIGPAYDGGYYLLGMKTLHSNLFENIEWSTDTVFVTTVAKCKSLNLSYNSLPYLHDIDEEKDLIHLKKENV
jgi:rSAM/selenodomain-associated transferase 1